MPLTFLGLGKAIDALLRVDALVAFFGKGMVMGIPITLPLASVLVRVIDVAPLESAASITCWPTSDFFLTFLPFQVRCLHQQHRSGILSSSDIQGRPFPGQFGRSQTQR